MARILGVTGGEATARITVAGAIKYLVIGAAAGVLISSVSHELASRADRSAQRTNSIVSPDPLARSSALADPSWPEPSASVPDPFERARTALARREPLKAISELDAYERAEDRLAFSADAAALRVEALRQQGRSVDAARVAERALSQGASGRLADWLSQVAEEARGAPGTRR